MEEKKEIPILISAAAVQITFGLEKYELPFFKNIYVTPDAYQRTGEKEIFVGHVSPEGIFISWKYFLQGYGDTTDNVNVAIMRWLMRLSMKILLMKRMLIAGLRQTSPNFHW